MAFNSYELSEWHGLYGLGRHNEPPDDFKVALYVCPNHTDDDIHSDHGYLETLDSDPLTPPYGCII